MTSEEFIKVIKEVVYKGSVDGVVSLLKNPPGRTPPEELLEMSSFFHSLNDTQKSTLVQIIDMACEDTLFGMLCVLDGVRAIEDGPDKGSLELKFSKNEQSVLLNDPEEDFLHDLL